MKLANLLAVILIAGEVANGQFDKTLYQPDYDYQQEHLLEDDDALLKDYISVQTPQEQRFLDALVIEAGRHVLFPELYVTNEQSDKPNEEEKLSPDEKPRFYEVKGQPEIEESYMNQKSRRQRTDCPEHCPKYKPVCGSDGKVYESDCHMLKENCGSANVTKGPWKRCQGKHYLCPRRCLDLNDPVCGEDGNIYHNICIMRKRNCGKLVQVMPIRKCYENFRQVAPKSHSCPEQCPEIYEPACGSNGVIYYNECFLQKRTCRQGIVRVDMEVCADESKCPEVCLPIADPVCGSDKKLYINQCRMMQDNCGKDIKRIPRRFCELPSADVPRQAGD